MYEETQCVIILLAYFIGDCARLLEMLKQPYNGTF